MFRSRLRSNLWATRRSLLKFLGLVLAIFALGTTLVGAANVPQNATIEAKKIVNEDVYLRAKTVAIEGTVGGTAAIAAQRITINGTVEDDAYLAAETVTVNGTIGGDAVIIARQVRINGEVSGDAIAIAQTVVANGKVGGDLRLVGEVLLLDERAEIGEDVAGLGESLESRVGSRVGRNMMFGGARALLAGTVQRNAIASAGAVALHGIFDGNVQIGVGNRSFLTIPFLPEPAIAPPNVPDGLAVADSAQIGGNFTYRSPETAKLGKKAWIAGSTVREPLESESKVTGVPVNPARAFWRQLQRFATLALVGSLLVGLKPHWAQSLARTVRDRPVASLGWGAATILAVGGIAIAIAFVAFVLAVLFGYTLRGLVLPVLGVGMVANLALLVAFGIFVSFVPQIAMSYWGGRVLVQNFKPEWSARNWISLCVGLVLFVAIAAIPVLGQIFSATIICLGLGALFLSQRKGRQRGLQSDSLSERRDRLEVLPAIAAEGTSEPESVVRNS
ncbi:hypothetical protein [Oscillatoria sp. FACHB-1406]|uniref:hypothetical protein n=1 Tax=Oscillatoria sp. FACHB-1406 TaxID=2692846 RepID=UPI0016850C9A|nr:hypothetical protein [Oscillatoria sp. FACHB-1406]MBD2576453.1 hypothetical protein [Oscillatoria sp. FACHB-1406]